MFSEKERSWHSQAAAEVRGIFRWLKCPMLAWMGPLAMQPAARAGASFWNGFHKSQNTDLVARQNGLQKSVHGQINASEAAFWSQFGEKN